MSHFSFQPPLNLEATMKKVLLVCAALALLATSAFADGADINFNACPGGTGALTDLTLDCVAGTGLQAYATFQPREAISDLVAIDCIFDIYVTGDLNSTANFLRAHGWRAGAGYQNEHQGTNSDWPHTVPPFWFKECG